MGEKTSLDGAIRIIKPELWARLEKIKSKKSRAGSLWNALSAQEKRAIIQGIDIEQFIDSELGFEDTFEAVWAELSDNGELLSLLPGGKDFLRREVFQLARNRAYMGAKYGK